MRKAFQLGWVGIVFLCLLAGGCADEKKATSDIFIVRVGEQTATVLDFKNMMEMAKSAYSLQDLKDPAILQEIGTRVLNQMVEELIIMDVALEHDIRVPKEEFETQLAAFLTDYPKEVFEQMLLENAISFESWKRRFNIRLHMQKIVAQLFANEIMVQPEDIAAYYEKHPGEMAAMVDYKEKATAMDQRIIEEIRREKIEKAYSQWMQALKKNSDIEINHLQVEKTLGFDKGINNNMER